MTCFNRAGIFFFNGNNNYHEIVYATIFSMAGLATREKHLSTDDFVMDLIYQRRKDDLKVDHS